MKMPCSRPPRASPAWRKSFVSLRETFWNEGLSLSGNRIGRRSGQGRDRSGGPEVRAPDAGRARAFPVHPRKLLPDRGSRGGSALTFRRQPPTECTRGGRVSGKDITAFTREMGALLNAAIPIPQALDGLGEEEENPALRAVVLNIADSVKKGAALSAALDEHPKLFSKLYVSMVRVGEEAGCSAQGHGGSGRVAGA
jgi:hypothetical protein